MGLHTLLLSSSRKAVVVTVGKAQRLAPSDEVPNLCIVATDEVENTPSLESAMAIYTEQAEKIVSALYTSLPGGTMDQILIKLLEKKASFFKVKF